MWSALARDCLWRACRYAVRLCILWASRNLRITYEGSSFPMVLQKEKQLLVCLTQTWTVNSGIKAVLNNEHAYRIYCWIAPSWSPLMYRWSPYCLNISERPSLSRCWLFARLIAMTNRFFLNSIYEDKEAIHNEFSITSEIDVNYHVTEMYTTTTFHSAIWRMCNTMQNGIKQCNKTITSSLVWVSFSCSINIFPSLVRT